MYQGSNANEYRRYPENLWVLENKLEETPNSKWYCVLHEICVGRSFVSTCPVRTLFIFSSLTKIDVESDLFTAFDDAGTDPAQLLNTGPIVRMPHYQYVEFKVT
jgi:hypothetical protein